MGNGSLSLKSNFQNSWLNMQDQIYIFAKLFMFGNMTPE